MTENKKEFQTSPVQKPAPRPEKHGAGLQPGRHKYGTATEVKSTPQKREKEK
jgi:hypothetical protein